MENQKINDNGDIVPENPDDDPDMYDGEDQYQPYNVCVEKQGAINEWRDKQFPWDMAVNELN